jgi:AAA domain
LTHTSTLSFFRDVETMTIPDAPGVGQGAHQSQEFRQGHGHRAPWASLRATPTETPFYVVHLGVLRKRTVVEGVLTALAPDKPLDTEAMDLVSGFASVGCVALDWQGRILVDQFLPAPFVFGVRRMRRKETLAKIDEEMATKVADGIGKRFGDAVEMGDPFAKVQGALDIGGPGKSTKTSKKAAAEDEDEPGSLVYEKPIGFEDLYRISKSLLDVAELPTDDIRVRVVVHTARRKPGKRIKVPDFKEDMLPSFFAKDIDRVLKAGVAKSGAALRAYLADPVPEADRVDILADSQAFQRALGPEALGLDRWPANPHHALNLAQQAAVGQVRAHTSGLVAVNGPPGTGKTTLLRDLVADMVLDRAARLVQLDDPTQGMTRGTITPLNEEAEPFEATLVNTDLVEGTSIVVASSNNAAVENISLALPTLDSIDGNAFPHASYLAQTAADVFAQTTPKGQKPPPVWGLVALRMGNRDNVRTVFKGLARPFAKEGDVDVVKSGLVDRLAQQGPTDPTRWANLQRAFHARQARVRELLDMRRWHAIECGNIPVLEAMLAAHSPLEETLTGALPWAKRPTRGARAAAVVRCTWAAHVAAQGQAVLHTPWSATTGPAFADELRTRVQRAKIQMGLLDLCWARPNAALFGQTPDALHRSSVWVDAKLEEARTELFLAAMDLHEAFLAANIRSLYGYLTGLKKVLTGEARVSEAMFLRIWNGLFLLAPVVSTTLASMRRMPGTPGWIGLLLIDEAGQATPQSVVGALARANKAVIVGDPLQIEPVFNVPAPIVERLLDETGTDPRFSPLTASAQTVADGVMAMGAWIPRKTRNAAEEWVPEAPDTAPSDAPATDPLLLGGLLHAPVGQGTRAPAPGVRPTPPTPRPAALLDMTKDTLAQTSWNLEDGATTASGGAPKGLFVLPAGLAAGGSPRTDRVWTGMPLRVHRRCQEPMFGVANAISYGGQMIQGTPALPEDARINAFGPSAWFDVSGGGVHGKVRTAEMDCLWTCLDRFHRQPPMLDGKPLSTFVVSPFVDVADACRQTAISVYGIGRHWQMCPTGTVHTFQGKEADIVLLVLGTPPGEAGHRARAWAAATANLVNVAITRARLRLYVIGSGDDWRHMPYFADLYASMQQAGRIIAYPKNA